jgi:hypothetical protein
MGGAPNILKGVLALLVEGECETLGEEMLFLGEEILLLTHLTGTLVFDAFALAADTEALDFLGCRAASGDVTL